MIQEYLSVKPGFSISSITEFFFDFSYKGVTYCASAKKIEKMNEPSHYKVFLNNDQLIDKFGFQHDFYYNGIIMQSCNNGRQELRDFYVQVINEIQKECHLK